MNSAIASIGKNLVLLLTAAFSALNLYYNWLNWRELFAVQCLTGLAYIFLSCYEYLNASYKASLPVQRYPYFSNGFVMTRSLKVLLFTFFAILLYTAESRIRFLYPVCVIIATTEAVILYLKYKNSLCFVNIYANYLLLVENTMKRVFASEIMIVEFRHEIFYFVKKNRKTLQINLEHIRERENFIFAINDWINRNNVLVSAESKEKINELIA